MLDMVVVGAGAVGSAATYHAARRGLRVAAFDRYDPPHSRGSTHGGSRIIRRAYFEGAIYLPLLERAYACWDLLEREAGVPIMRRSGALTIGARGSSVLEGARSTAEMAGIRFDMIRPEDLPERFPGFRMDSNSAAIFEPDAGWIDPEAAIRAHLEAAARYGARLHSNESVLSWSRQGAGFVVETGADRYTAAYLLICAGGWTASLLPELALPLTLERQVNVWYEPHRGPSAADLRRCPVYVWADEADRVLYGFPETSTGLKAGLHHAGQRVGRPEELDRDVHEEDIAALTDTLRRLLPDACGRVVRAATCFYTNTPDERFIIDAHPDEAGVVFASACSGHGFKMSSAVGESLVLLATGEAPAVNLAPYRADRNR